MKGKEARVEQRVGVEGTALLAGCGKKGILFEAKVRKA